MQVLNLTSEQVASLPAPERDQINQLVSLVHVLLLRETLIASVFYSANNLTCHLCLRTPASFLWFLVRTSCILSASYTHVTTCFCHIAIQNHFALLRYFQRLRYN